MLVEEAGAGSRRSRGEVGGFRVLRVAAGLEGGVGAGRRRGAVWQLGDCPRFRGRLECGAPGRAPAPVASPFRRASSLRQIVENILKIIAEP